MAEVFTMPNGAQLTFLEEEHQYIYDGRPVPSVTQILKAVGISPSFEGADEDYVRMCAEHGTLVHEEIEDFLKSGKEGITDEFAAFKRDIAPELSEHVICETAFCNGKYAGRVDMMGFKKKGTSRMFIMDHKTGKVHNRSVQAQMSMYYWGLVDCGYAQAGGKCELVCDDLKADKATWISFPLLSRDIVDGILKAYEDGVEYQFPQALVPVELQMQAISVMQFLPIYKEYDKAFKAFEKDLKAFMKATDAETCSIPNELTGQILEYFKTAPSIRKEFDEARFKEECPEIYEKYITEKTFQQVRSRIIKEDNV